MTRPNATLIGVTLAVFAAPVGAAARWPVAEMPICRAVAPRLSHVWARAWDPKVVRVADDRVAASLKAEDHADMLFKLGLLEGHLAVGRELTEAGAHDLALPHFGHPVRELYDDMADGLSARGIAGLDRGLVRLETLAAQQPGSAAMLTQFDRVMATVRDIRVTVPSTLRGDPAFMLHVVSDMTATSASEYAASIEDGRITKSVEYHDSRGFLTVVSAALESLDGGNPHVVAARAVLDRMRAANGALLPPEAPVVSIPEYRSLAKQFRAAAG